MNPRVAPPAPQKKSIAMAAFLKEELLLLSNIKVVA
jgi:hypothetical protein